MSEIPTGDWPWIDAAAIRFERAWTAGSRPRIEDYLAEADESLTVPLLEELLLVEHELRRRAGEKPSVEEYWLRFPDRIALVEAVFRRKQASSAAAHAQGRDLDPTNTRTDAPSEPTDENGVFPAGTRVRYFGDYELIKELGRGGMGIVFKARQISLNRPVAIKMIRTAALASEDELRRFQNEAEAIALLDHPHIVPILEVGSHEGQRYFSMKLISGSSLDKVLSDYTNNPKSAARLVKTAAEAVHHAHQRGILHRDLKPANILLDEHGEPYVTDFGLAKRVQGDSEMTFSGAIVGTPAYMAPEQASGRRGAVTTASDVYGLGAILYALLTGRAPFGGDSIDDTLEQVRSAAPALPSKINPVVPRDLEVICLKCVEKDPAERYPSAAALAEDLGRFAAGEPVSARAAGVVERLAKWARRKPTLAAAYTLGLLALLFGGLGGAAAWQWRAAERARRAAVLARGEAVTARDGEKVARAVAEQARDAAMLAEKAAVMARDGEQKSRERLAATEYGRTIQLAQEACRDDDVITAMALLDATPTDLRGWEWRFIHRLCHSELLTIRGHLGGVLSVSFSPDGLRLLTVGNDYRAKLWDAKTGAEILTLMGGSASFSPDGSRIVVVWAGMAKVRDAMSGTEILTLEGHTDPVVSASFSPDGSRIMTRSVDDTARVWDARRGVELLTLKRRTGVVRSASFSPDGSRVVTGSDDESAKVWEVGSGAELITLKGHIASVRSASFSPDGKRLVTGSDDKTAKVWDARSGAELLTLKGHGGPVVSASFSPDGWRIVTGSSDKLAKVWDANDGALLLTLKGHTAAVTSASFSPDGSRVVTGSDDKLAKVWYARSGPEFLTLSGHTAAVVSASFSPDGLQVVTGSWDSTARVWDAENGVEVVSLKRHTALVAQAWINFVTRASFNLDGLRVATLGGQGNTARVWDAKTGSDVFSFDAPTGYLILSSFGPDGLRVVGSSRNAAKVWNAKSGAEMLTLQGHTSPVISATFCPDGSRIVTGSLDKTAKVWDASSGRLVLTLTGHTETLTSVSFSPDASRIVTGSSDKTARVWDARTGTELLTLKGHIAQVTSASFSPDGSRIVTGSHDGTAKLWDTNSGAQLLTLKGHGEAVYSASFSPDGSRIVTTGGDMTARIWDARSVDRQFWVTRESRAVAEARSAKNMAVAEMISRIKRDPTIDAEVRDRASVLAEIQARLIKARKIEHLVQSLFSKLVLREDVLDNLRVDATLSESDRSQAISLAEKLQLDAISLNNESWSVARRAGETPAAYFRAVRFAEAACRLDSGSGAFLHTLGVAQYRAGLYKAALATLSRAEEIRSSVDYLSSCRAFLAMTHFHLGEVQMAHTLLDQLTLLASLPGSTHDPELEAFLQEAKAVILYDPVFPAQPFAR
jgi:WD40 repeat protein/tRNA A-37 threonylcarbamoyl transferase component Bud32